MKNPNIPLVAIGGVPIRTIKVTTPNRVEIDAVVLKKMTDETLLCYAQNRLFTVDLVLGLVPENDFRYMVQVVQYGETICEYCVIPNLNVE